MPALVRLYIRHVAFGYALSAVFVAVLLGWNVGDLRSLILGSPVGYVALAMLFVAHAVVFAGVQFGIAVMGLAESEGRGTGLPRAARAPELIPIPVERRLPPRRR